MMIGRLYAENSAVTFPALSGGLGALQPSVLLQAVENETQKTLNTMVVNVLR